MDIRKTKVEDIPRVMEIINDGKTYLKSIGLDQWQDGYPNEDVIKEDIEYGESYVVEHEGNIVATCVVSFRKEHTYDEIFEGDWLTTEECAVIHRTAVDKDLKGKNVSRMFVDLAEEECKKRGISSIKIDTHPENKSMIRFCEKNGFSYCGLVYVPGARVAFEKLV